MRASSATLDTGKVYGIGAFAVQLVAPWPDFVVAFSVQRALKNGHFDKQELDTLAFLGRHASRALTIVYRLANSNAITAGLFHLLDQLDGGHLSWPARLAAVVGAGHSRVATDQPLSGLRATISIAEVRAPRLRRTISKPVQATSGNRLRTGSNQSASRGLGQCALYRMIW